MLADRDTLHIWLSSGAKTDGYLSFVN